MPLIRPSLTVNSGSYTSTHHFVVPALRGQRLACSVVPLRPSVNNIIYHTISKRMFAASFYRANQPKTFSNQAKLPRLPVPDLETSLEGYLKSLVPVLEQKVGFTCI
jgi:carnitine O-acetyltransferase